MPGHATRTIEECPDGAPLAPSAETPAAPLGEVQSVTGSQVTVRFADVRAADAEVTVGSFLGVWTRQSLVVGVLAEIGREGAEAGGAAVGRVDLLGEILPGAAGPARFERGVRLYPTIGSAVIPIAQGGLRLIFDPGGPDTIQIGQLQQDAAIGAFVHVDDLVRKHFALLGSTGAGKSSAVALILREIMDVRPDLRIVLIDPHNEYGRAFEQRANVIGPANLALPFWLFNFEELIEVVFGKRRDAEEEIALLAELIPLAKASCSRQRAGAGGGRLLRLQPEGRPMTVLQLAGFPAEIFDVVVSALFRMAFEFGLWSDGAMPLLLVCEEAHHYAHADQTVGFGPAREALSRIAKEGRKYGVFLGLVTQRPAELDPTLISQCNTVFAMRMANERDQAIVRAAVPDAGSRLLGFLPSLGTREALAFGEGVPVPTRLRFMELPEACIPRGEAGRCGRVEAGTALDRSFVATVIERWRGSPAPARPQAAAAPRLDAFFVPADNVAARARF